MKGRLQKGKNADVVIFDPQTITDRATEEAPSNASVGVHYLLVGGAVVVQGGSIVAGVSPGRAVVGEAP